MTLGRESDRHRTLDSGFRAKLRVKGFSRVLIPAQLSGSAEILWIPVALRIRCKPSLSHKAPHGLTPTSTCPGLLLLSPGPHPCGHISRLPAPWVGTSGTLPAHPPPGCTFCRSAHSQLHPQSPVGPNTGQATCFFPEAHKLQSHG